MTPRTPVQFIDTSANRWLNIAPFVAGLACVGVDLAIQEVYLRMYSGLSWLIILLSGVMLGGLFLIRLQRIIPQGERIARFAAGASETTAAWHWAGAVLPPMVGGGYAFWWAVGVAVLSGMGLGMLSSSYWLRARRALITIPLLLAVAPPLIGPLMAQPGTWPARESGPNSSMPDAGTAVIFILLDELGAAAAQPIVDTLAGDGWPLQFRALAPVGDMTVKVIPQMFTGVAFPNARPCAPTTVCDRLQSLNFSTLTASRPDIDIVGFYHPYCAIQGLRWCTRHSPEAALLSWERWRCAAQRRSTSGQQDPQCRQIPLKRWADLVDSVLMSVDQAPFWTQGGMLYVHAPLPHPPGSSIDGSLPSHYRDNIKQAANFVRHVAARARQRFGDKVRLVIFSDHGLRYKYACSTPLYESMPCDIPDEFQGHEVPLIVAGTPSKALDRVTTNADIFYLVD